MIPYDELVIALQTWRAKQGLPVAQLSGALTPPIVNAPTAFGAAPVGFAPRPSPPASPPPRGHGFPDDITTPPPLDDSHDVDEAALIEESNDGNDYAMTVAGKVEYDVEATAIGEAPPGPSDLYGALPTDPGTDAAETDDRPRKPGHNHNDDW